MRWIDFEAGFSINRIIPWVLLSPIWVLFHIASRLRRFLYKVGVMKQYRPSKFVISVGNLTVGGTGKSPMISYLLGTLESKKLKAAVLTRGYNSAGDVNRIKLLNYETQKKGAAYFGDEPWMLFQAHPTVPFYCGKNRVESSKLAQKVADVLLLDDGMQHLQLERDLNLVLVDATQAFGNGHLLPLGPLREGKSALKFADALILTKTNLAEDQSCQSELEALGLQVPMFESQFVADGFFDLEHQKIEIPTSKAVYLFSGIGNPKGFEKIVEQLGYQVLGHYIMPDHEDFDLVHALCLDDLQDRNRKAHFICTEKDAARFEGSKISMEYSWLKMRVEMEPEFLPWLQEKLISTKKN